MKMLYNACTFLLDQFSVFFGAYVSTERMYNPVFSQKLENAKVQQCSIFHIGL